MEYIAKTKGKSSLPEALEIMKEFEIPGDGFGGILNFEGMTPEAAAKLVELGAMDPEQEQNSSPSIAGFIELAKEYKGMTFFGYRVLPPRGDERISIEGFRVPAASVSRKQLLSIANNLAPDELDEEDGELRAWWD